MNPSNEEQVETFVRSCISRMARSSKPAVAAQLATLRRGVGKEPGSQPQLWDLTLANLPIALQGTDSRPSVGERVIHTVLTLFALHQQGSDIDIAYVSESGISIGKAVRQMVKQNPQREEAIKRRFTVAVTSDSNEELAWHLRGLVQMLRSNGLMLDYPRLARELYRFHFVDRRDSVRLNWGRDFYRNTVAEPVSDSIDENK